MSSRGHAVQLFLAPEIRSALVRYMAKNDLDKEYATQVLLLKAMRSENLITQEIYEKYVYRYSRKLTPDAEPQKLTLNEQREKQKLGEKARTFSMLPSQWELHPSQEWRQRWISEAEKWQDKIPEAKTFLERFAGRVIVGADQK